MIGFWNSHKYFDFCSLCFFFLLLLQPTHMLHKFWIKHSYRGEVRLMVHAGDAMFGKMLRVVSRNIWDEWKQHTILYLFASAASISNYVMGFVYTIFLYIYSHLSFQSNSILQEFPKVFARSMIFRPIASYCNPSDAPHIHNPPMPTQNTISPL